MLFGAQNRWLPCGKSLAGSSAAFVACALVACVMASPTTVDQQSILFVLWAGMSGAVGEMLPIGILNDNLSMPLLAGLLLLVGDHFLGHRQFSAVLEGEGAAFSSIAFALEWR